MAKSGKEIISMRLIFFMVTVLLMFNSFSSLLGSQFKPYSQLDEPYVNLTVEAKLEEIENYVSVAAFNKNIKDIQVSLWAMGITSLLVSMLTSAIICTKDKYLVWFILSVLVLFSIMVFVMSLSGIMKVRQLDDKCSEYTTLYEESCAHPLNRRHCAFVSLFIGLVIGLTLLMVSILMAIDYRFPVTKKGHVVYNLPVENGKIFLRASSRTLNPDDQETIRQLIEYQSDNRKNSERQRIIASRNASFITANQSMVSASDIQVLNNNDAIFSEILENKEAPM